MKKQRIAKHVLSGLLALAMFAGVTLSVCADVITIDGSGFSDAKITTGTIYYWHKGAPPAKVDGTSYPTIITWDDKYYLAADNSFYNQIVGTNKTLYATNQVKPKVNKDDSPLDISWDKETPGNLSGRYHKDRLYKGKSVSELPFDFDVLQRTGNAVTLGAPDLPRFVAVYDTLENLLVPDPNAEAQTLGFKSYPMSRDFHARGTTIGETRIHTDAKQQASYAIWFPNPNTGSVQDTNKYWLVPTHRVYSYYEEVDNNYAGAASIGTKSRYVNSSDWFLDFKKATQENFTNTGWTYKPEHYGLNSRGYEARPPLIDIRHRIFQVSPIREQDAEDLYHIWAHAGGDAHLNSFYPDKGRDNLIDYVKNLDRYDMDFDLVHYKDQILTAGNGGGPVFGSWYENIAFLAALIVIAFDVKYNPYDEDYRYEDYTPYKDSSDGFGLYWGEPATISFCQNNVTVQKGQVQTFDGPIGIGHEVTVTVEDGGVLSCSDWIINNGTIVVKPGGTLLLQTHETANEQIRYGTISSLKDAAGDDGGRIYCDGNLIIMPDCKLCCSGKYGLKLGAGAQVVNYGAIIAENMDVAANRTIENRGDYSYVFAGYGLKDCGSTLLTESITGDEFSERKTTVSDAVVNLPANAVYGKGVARVYKNTIGMVSYTSTESEATVTGAVERLQPISGSGSGGLLAQYFTIDDGYPYTVYAEGSGTLAMSTRDTPVTFAIYEDESVESFMSYDAENQSGFYTEKYVIDAKRKVQIYKGFYFGSGSAGSSKLVYEGALLDWDGSDQNYFAPPETEEPPLTDVILSETHQIELNGAADNSFVLNPGSRVLIYQDGTAVFLNYSSAVKDFNAKYVTQAEDTITVKITWQDENYSTYQQEVYKGAAKDWVPTYIR